MSAIAALWDRAGEGVADRLARVQAGQLPYGPDRQRSWTQDGVGIGLNQRIALPEDRFEAEPVLSDGLVIAADIRLDNRDDLARKLGPGPRGRAEMADSAWLRLAWRRWGAESLDHLVGEFAFAVWDVRQRQLFCAVDQLGRRPLFYTTVRNLVAAASMPAGLLAIPGVSGAPDPETLARRLAILPIASGRSSFSSLSALPPGHILRVSESGFDVRSYHQFSRTSLRYRRDEEYLEHFREVLDSAVRCRLRAVGPIASNLSAGLDSGTVTAVAARALHREGQRLTAVTWRPKPGTPLPDVPGCLVDEGPAAAACAALYENIDHVPVHFEDSWPLGLLSDLAVMSAEPVSSPNTALLFQAAGRVLRDRGCRVLLVGQSGNITISYSGLPALAALFRRGRLFQLAREIAGARQWGSTIRSSLYRAVAPSLPPAVVRSIRRLGARQPSAFHDYSAIHPAFAATWSVGDVRGLHGAELDMLPSMDSWRARVHRLLQMGELAPRRKAAEVVYGYEVRDPTADLRVVDFCLSIPDDQFHRHGQPRSLVRRAMLGMLPAETLNRWQRGLQAADTMRLVGLFRAEFEGYVVDLARIPLAREALDLDGLRRILNGWPAQWRDGRSVAHGLKLLRGIAAGAFIDRFALIADRGLNEHVG